MGFTTTAGTFEIISTALAAPAFAWTASSAAAQYTVGSSVAVAGTERTVARFGCSAGTAGTVGTAAVNWLSCSAVVVAAVVAAVAVAAAAASTGCRRTAENKQA